MLAQETISESVLRIDRFVPHVSTVPANIGQTVGLHLRERILASAEARLASTKPK